MTRRSVRKPPTENLRPGTTPDSGAVPLRPLLPGSTIGVFGSGQLGRMLALEARRMDYSVHTFSPGRDTPTGQVASREVCGAYEDEEAVREFVQEVDVVTFEFENVPAVVADIAVEEGTPARPSGRVLHTAQNRLREKMFFEVNGLPVSPFSAVSSLSGLRAALKLIGVPAVLKTAAFGYDGKGQELITSVDHAQEAWEAVDCQRAVLESFVDFERELSVVAARGADGSFAHHGVIENLHCNHILDVSIAPARIDVNVRNEAVRLARIVLEELDVIGILCVEFFLTRDGALLVNEIAPRPHNSGHLTIEASVASQFEQQLRTVCDLPLGASEIVRPAVMVNLLGDLWREAEPDWAALLSYPAARLHLYGKRAQGASVRPGRKMGHITVTATTVDEALETALAARNAVVRSSNKDNQDS